MGKCSKALRTGQHVGNCSLKTTLAKNPVFGHFLKVYLQFGLILIMQNLYGAIGQINIVPSGQIFNEKSRRLSHCLEVLKTKLKDTLKTLFNHFGT